MNNLKLLRLTRGLSQVQMAQQLGMSPITFNRIERGWYSRPYQGLEDQFRAVFGPEWTFERLMQPVDTSQLAEPRA